MGENGRPTKLTQGTYDEIVTLLAEGNYVVTVCTAVGIVEETFGNWMERGEKDIDGTDHDGIYRRFFVSATRALAEGELAMVRAVRGKAVDRTALPDGYVEGDWRAAAEFLQRRYPERWGKRVQETRHTDADGGPLKVTLQIVDERILADGTGEDDGNGHNGDD